MHLSKVSYCILPDNTELNDLRIIICMRKPDVPIERISVCNGAEKLVEHDITIWWSMAYIVCHALESVASYV